MKCLFKLAFLLVMIQRLYSRKEKYNIGDGNKILMKNIKSIKTKYFKDDVNGCRRIKI